MFRKKRGPREMGPSQYSKEKASRVSLVAVGLLIVIKAAASVVTGSVGIRADAIHSVVDLSGVLIGFIAIRISGKPADERHSFGHDKAENMAGVVVGGLILCAAGIITYEAVRRLVDGGSVELVSVGIWITAAALVINVIVHRYASRVARRTESLALEATARDMLADALSSCAVLAGLVLVRLTGIAALDPIAALLIALLIARAAILTIMKSLGGLMDARLPESEEEAILSCIRERVGVVTGFHELRTRKSGSQRFIDFHMVVPRYVSVDDAHEVCDQLEREITARLARSNVTIHVEPCRDDCEACALECSDGVSGSRAWH